MAYTLHCDEFVDLSKHLFITHLIDDLLKETSRATDNQTLDGTYFFLGVQTGILDHLYIGYPVIHFQLCNGTKHIKELVCCFALETTVDDNGETLVMGRVQIDSFHV